jgi:hypothetical protein
VSVSSPANPFFGCRSWVLTDFALPEHRLRCLNTTAVFTGPYNQSYQNQRPLRRFCVFWLGLPCEIQVAFLSCLKHYIF